MAEPVIVDDGGSTRIRQVGKHLDDLLIDLKEKAKKVGNPVSLHVLFLRPDCILSEVGSVPLADKDEIEIASGNGQRVNITVNKGLHFDLDLEMIGTLEDPILEARQYSDRRPGRNVQQRRYVIVNAGSIDTIKVKNGPVFDASAARSLYTLLWFG